jgi:hypothetical protein
MRTHRLLFATVTSSLVCLAIPFVAGVNQAEATSAPLNLIYQEWSPSPDAPVTVNQWTSFDVNVSYPPQSPATYYTIQSDVGASPSFGFSFTPPQGIRIQAGDLDDTDHGLSITVIGGDTTGACTSIDSGTIEVDQAVYAASGALQTLGLQYDIECGTAEWSGTIAYNLTTSTPHQGYYIYGDDGSLSGGFGNDSYLDYLGDLSTVSLNKPIVGMAQTADGAGYWMVATDGGIFSYGDAQFYGSTGGIDLNKPIVGMAATPSGHGYWLVASDGGVFSYGDAQFYGSTGSIHLNKPIVGMAATPSGHGYWLVASDGGIFSYGDAQFYGSTGNLHLNKPVVGMAATPSGHGYWFVASDGGIFSYGDAGFYGSAGGIQLTEPIVGMASAPEGKGYWLTASDGGVFSYGSASFQGSLGGLGLTNIAGITG